MPADNAILSEIKANFDYAHSYWKDIYEEGDTDVRYEVEGPWTDAELKEREGRVTLSLDELGQYTNQIKNEFRQNKRAVKMTPRGDGADDKTAETRAGMIRDIEYQSKAQQAYVTCGESMVDRGYGFFKLTTDYEPGSFRRCIKVVRIQNPNVIYLDPDAKEADWSDGAWAFEIERMREKAFVRRFGRKAKVTSFTEDHAANAPGWITSGDNGAQVQVASYWRLDTKSKPLYLLENGLELNPADAPGAVLVTEAKLKFIVFDGIRYAVVDEREDNEKSVTQYISNGIEIIEENPTDWKEIPIIPMFGPEKWVSKGGVSKRVFLSAIRKARGAYKAYCYARSAMVERLAMDPRTPYEGYEGQFDTQTDFTTVNKNPQGYVEFKAKTTATGEAILSLPRRNLTEPQINQYEVAAESLRRAIQASLGGSPLPTSAQRQNQKSGVALQTIEQSTDQGNFHFTDNYNMALERAGRMMDDALDVVYDTPREVGIRDEEDKASTLPINQVDPQTGQPVGFQMGRGRHGVTISTGPSYQSQRDEATDFTNQLIAHPEILGPNAVKIVALLVKLRNLGPIGDQISKILDPQSSGLPPEVEQQMAAAQQIIEQLKAEVEALKAGDAIKRYTVDEQEKTKRVLGLIKVDQQDAETLLEKMLGALDAKFARLHELQGRAIDQEHQREMADAAAAQEAERMAQEQQAAEQSARGGEVTT